MYYKIVNTRQNNKDEIWNNSELVLLIAKITDSNSAEIIELLNELSLKGIDYFYNDYLLKVVKLHASHVIHIIWSKFSSFKADWTGISASQLEDFKSYKPTVADPLRFTFKGSFKCMDFITLQQINLIYL